jgi:hypothetical protein
VREAFSKAFSIHLEYRSSKENVLPPSARLEADEKRKRSRKISCNEGKSEENGKLNNNNFSHESGERGTSTSEGSKMREDLIGSHGEEKLFFFAKKKTVCCRSLSR